MASTLVIITSAILSVLVLLTLTHTAESLPYPSGHKGYLTDLENEADPELMLELFTRLGQSIARANDMENAVLQTHVTKQQEHEQQLQQQ